MTYRRPLDVVWQWRLVVAAGVLIGALVGWISAGGKPPTATLFQATETLIRLPERRDSTPIERIGPMATLGAVPSRVAARLGVDRRIVQSQVYVETPPSTGLLLITGRSVDRAQAEALATVTVEELIAELGGPNAPLRRLEPAVASPVETGDIQPPSSRAVRALVLAGFGLALGVGATFVVERFDKRIRSKGLAEDVLGVPVMAEVPPMPRSRDQQLMGQSTAVFEAYRGLRTSVDRGTFETAEAERARVIVVTSPQGGEGTTVTVAHLAAALGEIGRSVVAISANLRHPRLHLYFGKACEPGLTDVLRGAPDTRRLADLNLATAIPGVRFVASGAPVRNPAPLLDQIGDHLRDAKRLGDYVLIDSPPLLTTSDGADLALHADGLLLVIRAGRTPLRAASRSVELLHRLEIPVIGAVLVGTNGPIS